MIDANIYWTQKAKHPTFILRPHLNPISIHSETGQCHRARVFFFSFFLFAQIDLIDSDNRCQALDKGALEGIYCKQGQVIGVAHLVSLKKKSNLNSKRIQNFSQLV